ncbi:putative serine threonine protein kinase protein [Venturia nashicola]|uniref:Mechanosensitive ion channel protein n=1 Tax=Venturia nashicola TaxID=86259 RepID=A0A4Z1P773_9PEZI|nr:putative serine threonine protein kinase protein [Venturia nashicola]TLD37296.1 putative serine threonine protein kinase protein [Venturia nashicola]
MSPSPTFPSFSGFQSLPPQGSDRSMNEQMIPLEKVVSYASTTGARRPSAAPIQELEMDSEKEKHGFHRGMRKRGGSGSGADAAAVEQEDGVLTTMGRFYTTVLNFSVFTRYCLYLLPLAVLLTIPIIVGCTAAPNAKIGGVRMVWLFVWIEIVWLSLWGSKIFAMFLPRVLQFVAGVVSPAVRKYCLVLRALEIPLSLVGWALVSLVTFTPLMLHNPDTSAAATKAKTAATLKSWQTVLRQILGALLACTLLFLFERLIVQLISISYHGKQFDSKIKEGKHKIYLLSLLYDASRTHFPEYCQTFLEEDYIINDALNLSALGGKKGKRASGAAAPMRMLHQVGRVGDQVTSVFGKIAQEVTGKQVFNSSSAHAIVTEALDKTRACEALAKRIWMSFVCEGRDNLYLDDLQEVLGANRKDEAEECFASLDRDGNGDVSLDEMILTVTEIGRGRKALARSMHDVDQAIKVLDNLLSTVVFIISIFVFIAFLNKSFTATLATAGTALLSMSFVFAVTCQEVLGSCIFLFVKHPYDIGDRIDLSTEQLTVEHISLLFTVFKRVQNGKMVQIPNIVLNSVWIENVSRSKFMREQISIFCHFDTSIEDIEALRQEMIDFVTDSKNSRDFQPDIDIEVVGIAEMNKMELRIECKHKSNWANETVRAARRSKFMCALVLALRKVPIYAPGSGDAALGSAGQPAYSVAVTQEDAAHARDEFAAKKAAKRLLAKKEEEEKGFATGADLSQVAGTSELRAMHSLNSRSPGRDKTRDEVSEARDDVSMTGSTLEERHNLTRHSQDEVRGMLQRENTKGRRHPATSPNVAASLPRIEEPEQQFQPTYTNSMTYSTPTVSSAQYASPPNQQQQRQGLSGNAFMEDRRRQNENLQPGKSNTQNPY